MTVHLDDDEQFAIKTFATWFRNRETSENWTMEAVTRCFDWDEVKFHVVMKRLESFGVITDRGSSGIDFLAFTINPSVCDAAAEIAESEKQAKAAKPPDLVDDIIRKARSHPKVSFLIVAMLALAFGLTIVNGVFDLAEHIIGALNREPAKAVISQPATPTPVIPATTDTKEP